MQAELWACLAKAPRKTLLRELFRHAVGDEKHRRLVVSDRGNTSAHPVVALVVKAVTRSLGTARAVCVCTRGWADREW